MAEAPPTPGPSDRTDVVVLGAGPAGLVAAWHAARAGHGVVVLERGAAPGGMAASLEVGGQRVDLGSHRLHPSTDPALLSELREVLGPNLQWRGRNGSLRLDGSWVRLPLVTGDLVRTLPPRFVAGAAREAVLARFRSSGHPRPDTFAEVVRAGLGPTMLERFYGPYARKLWGLPADELSGELARRRIAARSPGALLARLRSRDGGPAGFWYPATGFGAIPEALTAAATAAGAAFRCGADVTGLDLTDPTSVTATLAGGASLRAGLVLSTVPLPVLARITQPPPPATVARAAGGLGSRAMVLVYLVLARPRWTGFDAHYLPGPEQRASRVSEPKGYRDGPDPEDRTVLCVEVPCARGDETWSAPDDELAATLAVELEAGCLPAVRPVEVVTRRLPAVYPVLRPGQERDLAEVDAWAAGLHRVTTLGRGGLFTHDNSHHAMALGAAAAAALRTGGGWDPAAWSDARQRARSHVVED
ncbi:FAD-dependent oxidoreductase [soil metagenome]